MILATGDVKGRWTLIDRVDSAFWLCVCQCGTSQKVRHTNLVSSQSLGCRKCRSVTIRHGHAGKKTRTPEYRVWQGLRNRCLNPLDRAYHNYGGRGIQVCSEWAASDGFDCFISSVGLRPSPKHSLDRIDNNGHYEPGNCRWTTRSEQIKNRRPLRAIGNFSTTELWNEICRRAIAPAC